MGLSFTANIAQKLHFNLKIRGSSCRPAYTAFIWIYFGDTKSLKTLAPFFPTRHVAEIKGLGWM